MPRDERPEVLPIAGGARERCADEPSEEHQLQHRQRPKEPGAGTDAYDVHGSERRDRRDGHQPQRHRAERHDDVHVAGDPPRERGGDPGVHDEEAFPPVQERQLRSERLPQIHVSAAGLRVTRREGAVTERATERHAPDERPHDEHPEGRRERADDRPGGQEDPHGDHLAHHDRRGRPHGQLTRQGVARTRHQNVARTANWNARGPPEPNTPPAVVTARPNADDVRYPGSRGSPLSRTSTFEKPE